MKCKQRARDLLYWTRMASQIEDKVSKRQVCSQYQKAQAKEPMITSKIPDRPWAKIGVDLFEYNNTHYLLSVDYYSKFTVNSTVHTYHINGEAERAVQTVKNLLVKAKDPYKATSPAQRMMGRRLKTSLPTTAPLFKSQTVDEVQRMLKKQKEKQKQYYDKCTGKELPPLQPGETIRMQHGEKWIPAKVLHKHQSLRSYLVESEQTGQKY